MPPDYEYEWETVTSIPVKRIYEPETAKIKQTPKLSKEFEVGHDEILFKVKLVAINYAKDLSLLNRSVVPGNKIIGRVFSHSSNYIFGEHFKNPKQRYLVFPYTNCIQQGIESCLSCQKVLKENCLLSCERNLEFGYTLDGGMQDFMIVKYPHNALIPLPSSVSSHDAALSLEIVFPLWLCIKSLFFNKIPFFIEHEILVVIDNLQQELNDVLIACRLLHLDEALVTIVDSKTIQKLTTTQRLYYKSKFRHAFLFNFNLTSIDFVLDSVISTGLESTKSRYTVVFFNQYNPSSLASFQYLAQTVSDKTTIQFSAQWYHQPDFIELLGKLRENNTIDRDERPSFSSQDTVFSSVSSMNSLSTDLSSRRPRFRGSIDKCKQQSWLWYCKDYNLAGERATKDINQHIEEKKRVCYINKQNSNKLHKSIVFV